MIYAKLLGGVHDGETLQVNNDVKNIHMHTPRVGDTVVYDLYVRVKNTNDYKWKGTKRFKTKPIDYSQDDS